MPNETNGKTVTEMMRDDLKYVRSRLDQIYETLSTKADKTEVVEQSKRTDSLTKKVYFIVGIIVAVQAALKWLP